MSELDFDVLIVGGRPAGASLAARLGARGRRVLVIDRASFPSAPAVPSCPIIYSAAMHLLDELGLDEKEYAHPSARCSDFVIEFHTWFDSCFRLPEAFGRDYVYGIDRARFDNALWKNLAKFPSVTARAGTSFVDLIKDDRGVVTGAEIEAEDGSRERVHARCVIGADGRFSAVARKAGARVLEDFGDRTSTVYYADWEGVAPYDETYTFTHAHIYATGRGTDVLHIPAEGGRTTIATHQRSDRVQVDGDAEKFYHGVLESYPRVARRLTKARRATPVVGIKKIGNRYLEAGGPGWALVGDALHHKDPVDGQGIYDALVETKVLDEALVPFFAGERVWSEAVEVYRRRVREETYGMFLATMDRLKRELYEEPPELVIRSLLRWMLKDPEYQERFLLFLCRAIPAETWLTPKLMRGAALRGIARDVRGFFRAP